MKTKSHTRTIRVRLIEDVELDAREADFLRKMARFCSEEGMPGSIACGRLVELLNAAGVPELPPGPVYGIFEDS